MTGFSISSPELEDLGEARVLPGDWNEAALLARTILAQEEEPFKEALYTMVVSDAHWMQLHNRQRWCKVADLPGVRLYCTLRVRRIFDALAKRDERKDERRGPQSARSRSNDDTIPLSAGGVLLVLDEKVRALCKIPQEGSFRIDQINNGAERRAPASEPPPAA